MTDTPTISSLAEKAVAESYLVRHLRGEVRQHLSRLINRAFKELIFGKASTDEEIIAAIEPWTLACAVGSQNGSLGVPMTFSFWLDCSRKNWMPRTVRALNGISETKVVDALKRFVEDNKRKNYAEVLREQEKARGLSATLVLGPGQTMTIETSLPFP